jgi:hypothetical protein
MSKKSPKTETLNIFTFHPYNPLGFQLELLDLLKTKGFRVWLEQDGNKNQIVTDATSEEIDWVTGCKNFLKCYPLKRDTFE